jgi:hypothetical protein
VIAASILMHNQCYRQIQRARALCLSLFSAPSAAGSQPPPASDNRKFPTQTITTFTTKLATNGLSARAMPSLETFDLLAFCKFSADPTRKRCGFLISQNNSQRFRFGRL